MKRQMAMTEAQFLAHIERMCATETARTNAVRQRLGLSALPDPLPSPQFSPRRRVAKLPVLQTHPDADGKNLDKSN